MKTLFLSAGILALSLVAASAQTLTPFSAQARDMATKAAAAFPDYKKIVLIPEGLVVNGKLIDYPTLSDMTVDQVIAFGQATL